MFAAVTIEPRRPGLGARLGQALRPPRPTVRRLRRGAYSYWQISAPTTRRGVDWALVAECAGRQRRRLVVDPSVALPDDGVVGRFEPRAYCLRLAFNAAKAVLERSRVELWKRTVGVIDPAARCQQGVMELLSHATCVKVCTDAPERYEAFCRQMLELYGAPVLLCPTDSPLADCLLAVSAAPASPRLDEGLPTVCALPGAAGGCKAGELRCSLPPELEGFVPPGMDVTYFLGALYELGHRQELGRLCPESCRLGGRAAGLSDLTALVRERSGKITRWQGEWG